MESLINTIHKIEESYRQQRGYLRNLKLTAIFFGAFAVFFAAIKLTNELMESSLDFMEIISLEFCLFLMVIIPIIFTPLYRFFSDKILASFNWEIKRSIFQSILEGYKVQCEINMKTSLPNSDIKNLGFEKGLLHFSYGDDLIYGLHNGFKFRMAEMHSTSLFRPLFDGLVGVIVFPEPLGVTNYLKGLSDVNSDEMKILQQDNKIYFLLKGEKDHFEFKFVGNDINREKLISDYHFFDKLVRTMFKI
jgi:hypothetical protein